MEHYSIKAFFFFSFWENVVIFFDFRFFLFRLVCFGGVI
ncbi:Hypothetical protein HPV225_0916 [Helicobacter pylori v225d]|nr:Hypothetical protein HPV225_0916 [Helicobacter pylori v225d]